MHRALRLAADHVRSHPVEWVLALTLLAGVLIRLHRWTAPILDQHAFRQTQTASTVWLWHRDGFDFFSYHVPQFGAGHWVLELPVYQASVFALSAPLGATEQMGRAVSVLAYVAVAVLTYLIGQRLIGRGPAVLALVLFSFLPINVFYYRAFMIDPLQIALTLLATYALFRVYERFELVWFVVFAASLLLAVLGKAAIVMAIGWPMAVLTLRILLDRGVPLARKVALVATWLATGALALVWVRHADGLNEASNGMTFANQRDWFFGSTISDVTLWTTVGQRLLDNLQLPGVILVAIGVAAAVTRPTRYRWELLSLAVGIVVSVAVLANLNTVHDYYQLPYYVPLAMFAGLGLWVLVRTLIPRDAPQGCQVAVGLLVAVLGLWTLSLFQSYFHPDAVNYGLRGQALEMRANTPDELLLVASSPGDPNEPMHLYEARRRGWRIDTGDVGGIADRLRASPEIGAIVFLQDPGSVPAQALAAVGAQGYRESHRSPGMLVLRSSAGPSLGGGAATQ